MKNIYKYWLLILTLALVSNGCDNYDVKVGDDPGIEANVSLSPDEILSFTAEGGNTTVPIVTNLGADVISWVFILEKDDEGNPIENDWCTAELVGKEMKIAVTENIKYESRSIKLKVKVFNVSKIITIDQEEKLFVIEPSYPIEGIYKVDVPALADFETTKIYKVMDGQQKIAEICLEYLNGTAATRAIVGYAGTGGSANYAEGMVLAVVNEDGTISTDTNAGGLANFDVNNEDFLEYYEGYLPAASSFYVSAYGITIEEQVNEDGSPLKTAQAEPYLVRDRDGNSYPVVKVGCEVWLGSNLRATRLDGDEVITVVAGSENIKAAYAEGKAFATYPKADSNIDLAEYGYLYSPLLMTGDYEDMLGRTIIDGNWRVATGGGNNDTGIMGTNTDWQRLFKYIGKTQLGTILTPGYTWNGGGAGEFDQTTISNITGLTIVAAGEIYNLKGGGNPYATHQAFVYYGGGNGRGYNIAERDQKAIDMAGVREWAHDTDACSIRLVRIDGNR